MRARIFVLSALGIFFLALLIILTTDTACAESGSPDPCFLFPEGTDWYLGGRGYHNGCEGTNIQCGPIMGYDYIAPLGTPILAPFDGTVTASCHHDGVGNTVFRMVSSDGEWEFGSLHQECKVSGPVKVKAGEVVAFVDKIGMANGIPHSHAWFRNTRTGQNTPDHDQFWNCIGDGPPPPEPPPSEPPPEEKEWWEKILDKIEEFLGGIDLSKIIEAIRDWFKGIFQPGEPPEPTPPETKVHKFSISAQKPGNKGYQHNVRAFFAWVTSG